MQEKTLILIVEDNPAEAEMLSDALLENPNYEVIKCNTASDGMDLFNNNPVDLVVLDVMLPDEDGYSVAKQIREIDEEIPIIFLTSKNMIDDEVSGFKSGGDDYLTKPFDKEILHLRIQAILKRTIHEKTDECFFEIASYKFDCQNLELVHGDEKRRMTKREADVLHMLCNKKNKLVKREELLTEIWGDNDYFNGRSLDVFITKLRKYLKNDSNIRIENIHGVGFVLDIVENNN